MLYMTDDPQWHNEVPGVETLDSAAYSAYKGQQVDLTTRDGFGEYSYDLFHEVMDNYPDLSGLLDRQRQRLLGAATGSTSRSGSSGRRGC